MWGENESSNYLHVICDHLFRSSLFPKLEVVMVVVVLVVVVILLLLSSYSSLPPPPLSSPHQLFLFLLFGAIENST